MNAPQDVAEAIAQCYPDLKQSALSIMRNHCLADGVPINDARIHNALALCLNIIHVHGIIIHFDKENFWQACFKKYDNNTMSVIENLKKTVLLDGCRYEKQPGFIRGVICNNDICKSANEHKNKEKCTVEYSVDHIFLVINPNQAFYNNLPEGEQSTSIWQMIFATLREVFMRRNYAYRHFPQQLSQHYWNGVSLLQSTDSLVEKFEPPWAYDKELVSTITLSLDLRKSTISMDQATDLGKYANWMRDLVQTLTEIALDHLAVFDKFTGDGIIVHFLNDDINRLISLAHPGSPYKNAMELAVICAAKMIDAVEQQLVALREFLQNDFANFGAAVGLDVGMAKWSADHAGNPIVVGRGLVGACRNCSAPAGTIHLVNAAEQSYRKTELYQKATSQLVKQDKTKDFPKGLVVKLWALDAHDVLRALSTPKQA